MTSPLPKESPTAFAVSLLGIVPHAKQAEFLECRADTKVACAGRRWGKSTACAIDALWWAITRPGTTQFVIAPTADQARIIWDRARELAEQSVLAELITKVVQSPFPELRLTTLDEAGNQAESVIMARSSSHDAKYLRGHGADRVIVDECAFVPEIVLSQTVPPMLSASSYRELVLISTPFGTGTYFHHRFCDGRGVDPTIRSFHYPSSSNPRLPTEYLEQQRRQMTQLAYQTEYEALFLDDQASVFRHAVIQAAIDDTIGAGAVEGHRYVIGYDPARYADRSGVAVLDVTSEPQRAVEVRDLGGHEYLQQAAAIRGLSATYNRAQVLLDATSHDQMVEELSRNGVRAQGYKFSNESKRELIDGLVLALERGNLRIPNHADLIKELTYYRFETTASGNVKLGAPDGPGHFDDLVTALALAVWKGKRRMPYSRYRNDPEILQAVAAELAQEKSPPEPPKPDSEESIEARRLRFLQAHGLAD